MTRSWAASAAGVWPQFCRIANLRITLGQPKAEIAELVRLAAEGIEADGLSLWVKNCSRAFAGRAYRSEGYSVVRIGAPHHFPIRNHRYPGLKTAPIYDLESWQEALVLVTAHELRHQEQFQCGRPASEIDAERWAVQRLEAYRAGALGRGQEVRGAGT